MMTTTDAVDDDHHHHHHHDNNNKNDIVEDIELQRENIVDHHHHHNQSSTEQQQQQRGCGVLGGDNNHNDTLSVSSSSQTRRYRSPSAGSSKSTSSTATNGSVVGHHHNNNSNNNNNGDEYYYDDNDNDNKKMLLLTTTTNGGNDDTTTCTSSSSSSPSKPNSNSNNNPAPPVPAYGGATHAVAACVLYSFCSVSMVLVNKSLASSYNHLIEHDLNILLVVFQAIVAVVCVETCKNCKLIESYPSITRGVAQSWAPVNILFCLMLFTSMAALQTNSVPMVTVFKNVANIFTATGDYIFFGNKPEVLVIASFVVMLMGAMSAAQNDITMTATGFFWMLANCCSTSGYILYMKYATKHVKLSKFGMVFVNNLLCIVFLLPVAYMNGEVNVFFHSSSIHTWDYFNKNAFAGFIGFFLNFASLNCVSATGPTTYAIIGSVNKIPVIILGYFLFRNTITTEQWFFIAVSLCGGFLFSYAKIRRSTTASSSSSSSRNNKKMTTK